MLFGYFMRHYYLQANDNCPNYLTLSVFVALFCCLPLGGLAIRYSIKVYDLIHNAFKTET